MRKSEITAIFKTDIEKVWEIVTNNEDWSWRSDISKLEVIDKDTFVEYYPNGNSTEFVISKKDKCKTYEFKMSNKMFNGMWVGNFYQTKSGGTKIVFIEYINIPNPVINALSYLFMNLKGMQRKYIKDLKIKLGE